MIAPPRSVVLREVGLRDGLQSIARVLPTERKLEWIRDAHAAGQREIEVGSFVPARLLPQLADTAELVAYATTLPGLCGQDFERLITLRAKVAGWLEGEPLHGTLWRAALPKTLSPAPAPA